MRKVVLFISMSLDGYIADSQGDISWLGSSVDEMVEDTSYETFYDTIDAAIMGETTYRQITEELAPEAYPYHDVESYIMTDKPLKLVNEHVTLVNEDITQLVKRLKTQDGKDIWIVGGGTIIAPLITSNLIDEYQIAIIPKLLGNGIPLFRMFEDRIDLRLKEVKEINEFVYVTYTDK